MATLYKRENGMWAVNYMVHGKRHRKCLGTKNKELARTKLAELQIVGTRRKELRLLGEYRSTY